MRGLALLLLAACAAPKTPFDLPEAGPVLTLAHEGTRRPQPPLVIHPDGSMRSAAGETRLDRDELQALLRYLIEEQRFFDIDSDAVRLAIHQENSERASALAVFHAPTTVIELNLRDRTHRVSVHALQFEANAHPSIASLQQLARIRRRIVHDFSVALLGGPRAARKLRDLANGRLRESKPGSPPFTLQDLAASGRRADGALVAHFRRDESATEFSYVIVVAPPGGTPVARLVETR